MSWYFFFKQKTAYEIGLGIPAEPLFRSPTYQRRAPLRLPLEPPNGCGRPGRAPERFLPLDITSLLLHVIFHARFLLRQDRQSVVQGNSVDLGGRRIIYKQSGLLRERDWH